MNNKKIFLILILLVIVCIIGISSVFYFPIQQEKLPGGKVQPLNNGLDYDYMWSVTEKLSNVVHNYSEGVSKGRQFGSWGCENWTANYIEECMNNTGLKEVEKLQLGTIKDFPDRNYSSLLDVIDYEFVINNPDFTYDNIPKSEVFPGPSACTA